MAATIAESDKGGEIAYYLGSNISEAERISRLSPVAQVRAIAALEAKFTSPPVKATTAPEPTKPVSAGSANMKSMENMSMADYMKARAKQLLRIHFFCGIWVFVIWFAGLRFPG